MAVVVPARVYANPEGGIVSAGQATITVRPAIVDVHQQSDKAVIDWRSFDIDNGETTQFHQPNANAIALNRVHSSQASVINGALKANGNVIVVNQNGVLFGRNATVDVNGLVATTADIDNDKFMNQSRLHFDKPGNPNARIVNQGQITAKESGLVGFVAPSVENDGVIAARLGRVHLASGDKATVDFYGDGLMEVAVSDDVRQQLVKNTGNISADGGTVALTAAAGNRILASAIEVGGSVSTQTVGLRNGRIVIAGLTTKNHGVAGTVNVSGNLNVAGNAAGQKGGSIAVTGDKIRIASTAKLNASGHAGGGDIKIGGDYQGKGATHTASQLIVERGSSILNNALYTGNGGRTILWSDGATDFAGSISNRGGAFGGNGGFVEVSGKQLLGYRGTVDTRAPLGSIGTLLLDPANLTISNLADSDVTAGTPFDSTGAATSNLNVGTLVGALGSSNVIISTAGGTGGQGDITFVDAVAWNSGFSLTANADRHIFVNAAISNAGSGGIFLNANTAGSNITVAAPISTGGAINLSAAQDVLINNSLTAGGALTLTATGRDIIANASGVLTSTGALVATSGRDTTFGANVTAGADVTVGAGRDITLAASRTLTNGAASNLSLQAAGGSTAGTGNLNLNGNLNVGTGSLTLLSGINGTRASWTATGTNLLRQGATFGATNISGFLNLVINRDLNSTGAVQLTANNTGGTITTGAGTTVSGTNITTNSTLNTTINGTVNASGIASYTSGQDLVIGATGSSTSTGNTTVNATRDVLMNGSLTTGGAYGGSVGRDIIMGAASSLSSTGALALAARDIVLGNVTSTGNISATASRDLTTLASTTITNGAANNLTLNAAGGSTAGTGNLTLNGNLNAGTGAVVLVSGINGTRPSWTANGTNLLRQGATFGAFNISGFLNLIIDRDINSNGNVTLVGNNTGGTITVNSGRTVSGVVVSTNSALDTTINGAMISSGAMNLTSLQDVLFGATGSLNAGGNLTFTVTRDTTMASGSSLTLGGILNVGGRDATFGTISGSNALNVLVSRNITTLAGTTQASGPTSNISFQASGGNPLGTGNLTLNGNLSVGTGGLTLVSGINGTRPSWTANGTNLVRQGATFGAVSITGLLNLVIDRDINSSSTVNLNSSQAGGNITINNTRTVSGTAITTNSNLNTTVNGAINAGTTLTMTAAQDLLIGATGSTTSTGNTGFTVTRDLSIAGPVSSGGTLITTVTRDIIMSATGSATSTANMTMTGRDITFNGPVAVTGTFNDLNVTATRNLTVGVGQNISSGSGANLSLRAANGVVTGTGNLTINGIINAGAGTLQLTSGVNGTRPNWTADGTNLLRQGATFGPVFISGFLDLVINRDINSTGNVSLVGFRDLTLGATYTVSAGPTNSLNLAAANNVVGAVGNLYINGNIHMGTGALTLLSGQNGTRPDYTMTGTNFTRQGATWGSISINGFRDTTVDTDINSNGNISINSYRDLNINALRTVTSGNASGIVLTAANNLVAGTGNLNLNGVLRSGTGALTLTSGVNGTRPSLTMDGTNIQRVGASFGTVTINGFLDTFINDNIIGNSAVNITSFRDLTLNALNSITTGTASGLSLRAANGVVGNVGALYLNGVVNVGNGGLTFLSGTTRPNFTMTTSNVVPNNTNFGAVSITGFQDIVIDRNMTSTAGISINAYRDLTIAVGRTVTTSAAGALALTAANNAVAAAGNLYLNGNIGAGTGGLTLLSGVNGTRPDWTATTTNLLSPGANYGVVSIQGFRDLTVDRNITGTTSVTLLSYRDLTINAGDVVASNAAGSLIIRAAGGVPGATGRLNINGELDVGTGALTLVSGINGTRPTFTADSVNLTRLGATFGAINVQGFADFIVDRVLNSNSTVSFSNNTRVTLSDDVTSSGVGSGIAFTAQPVYIAEGATVNVTSNNGAITFGSTLDDTVGGVAENLVVNSGTATTTFTGNINGIGLAATGNILTFTPTALGVTRPLQNVALTSTTAFSTPSITASQILLRTTGATANLTIAAGRVLTASSAGDAIVLAAGQNFVNNNGVGALVRPGGGRYIVYSTAPGSDTTGGLTYDSRRFSCAFAAPGTCAFNVTTGSTVIVPGTGNVFLYTMTPIVLVVNPQSIADIIYGSAVPNLTNYAYVPFTLASGYLNADDFANDVISGSINGQTNYTQGSNIGSYNISYLSGDLVSALGYGFDYQPLTNAFSVLARHVTIDLTGTAGKVYNGNNTATLSGTNYTINNIYSGDLLTLGVSSSGATYNDKNVGVGKTVTANGLALTGVPSGNYILDNTSAVAGVGTITARVLNVTGISPNKVYDGTTTSSATLSDDRVGGDSLTIGYGTALFGNKNVGTGKTVTIGGITVTGTDAGNYTFNAGTTTTANITARSLTIGATGINKIYNGNTTGTVTLGDDRVGGDVLTLGYASALFGDKNVANGKALNVSGITLGGADAGNYTFNSTAATTADITARALTVSATGINRVYNGTNIGTVTLGDNRVGGDVLTIGYGTALFGDKNVANGKTVTVGGITVGGTDAGNYTFNTGTTTTANITPYALTVSATGINKVYNGNTTGTVTLGDNRIGGDVLTLGYGTALFGDKNVGNGKAVTVSGITLGGADAGNYTFNSGAATTADITPRALTVSATGINKVYNGNATGTVTLGDDRVGGDVLTLGYGSALFGDKNVANGKALSVSGITVTGTDAGNYTFNSTAGTTADITPRALTISATGINRVYDGTNIGTVTLGDNRVGGDVLTTGYTNALFSDKNVANGKTVNVSGITLGGADAGNYTFNTTGSTTANITQRALTVSAAGINKVYDGNAIAGVTLGDDRVGGDVLTISFGSSLFPDKNVGNGRAVNVSGINVTGTDAGNYSFNTSATTSADITPRALTVSATGINKIYNGNNTGTVTLADDRVGGDVLTLGYSGALFGDKNVANGKALSVSGITVTGTDAGNYTFNSTAGTTADITPRALAIGAIGVNRVYDGTDIATVTLTDNRVGGDVLTLGYGSALFSDKNVGTGKTVNVSGMTLGGTDAGNYTFNTTGSTTANITQRALTVSAAGINKVYDGNATAGVTLGDDRVGGDVLTISFGSSLFPDKNVGNGRTITVSGINVTGTDAGNYSFNTSATTSADITQRALTVSATGINKVYDGSAVAGVTLGDDRVGGDVLTISFGSSLFPDKNVGNGRAVNVTGINVTGTDAGNYSFNTSASTSADITQRALTITAAGINKVYDGSAIAGVTFGDNRVGGDVLSITYGSALFPDKNVGNGRTVNVTGLSLAGMDAGNYTYNTTASTSANITPAVLTVGASGINRVYNGSDVAGVTLNDNRIGGDVLSITYGTALFPDKNVGNGRTVTVGGINVTGADAGNYTFNAGTTTTANITPYALVVSASGSSKTYNGNAVASVTLSDNRVGGDVLTIIYGSALFPDQNAGVGRTITVNGINVSGTDAGNYTYNTSTTTTADINKATLTVTAANQNVIYGTVVPSTTLSYGGFIGLENAGDLGTAPVASSGVSGIVNAGTYTNNYTVGGGVDGNYSFVYVPGTLTVGKKTLNVTANNHTVTYGTAVPAGTLTYSGFISGEDATDLTLAPVVNSGQSGVLNAGTYTNNYTVSGGSSTNYDFSYFNGNLVVTKKDLNVTAGNRTITYGQSVPASSISYTGFVNGDDSLDLDVLPTLVSGQSGIVNAGTYTNNYTVSGGSDNNYTYTYAPGTLTVTQAGLNVTVNNQSITYGTVVPGTTITYTGFVNGDNEFDLAVMPTISSGQSGVVNAGTYTGNYTANGGVSGNYAFNYIAGNLVVSKKALNVTADNRTVTYGTTVPTSALTYSGFIAGEDVTDLISAPSISSGQSGIVNAGTYVGNYAISGGAADNYYFNFTPGDLTVTARTLNVSALPQTIIYGTTVPTGSITYSGFAAGEDVSYLAVAPTLSSANSGIVNAGTYVNNYTVSGGVSSNYTFVYSPANLVVTKRALNVTANAQTITYGTVVPGTTLTYSGFFGAENATFLDVAPTITSGQSGVVNAGVYVGNYVAAGGVDTNYSFVYTPGTLTVNRAALTITANNVNKVYGNGTTFNGYNVSGLQLGETVGSVTLTTNASTSAGGQWNVGTWNVEASGATGGTFNAANYTINYLDGTMVITPRVLTVTPTGGDRVYDGTDIAHVVLADDRVAGDAIGLTYADARFPDKNAGVNRLVLVSGIAMGGADAGNYTVASTANTTATITRRILVINPTALDKVQDGNSTATVTFTDDRLGGDVLVVGYASANFPDSSLGNFRTVTINGITLTGTDSANYSVTPTATAIASIYASGTTPPPHTGGVVTPPTVIKVSQDTGSVVVTATDDGIFATPSTGYQLIYLPFDAPNENRWRNKPLRAGVGGVPIVEPTAWYRWVALDDADVDADKADI